MRFIKLIGMMSVALCIIGCRANEEAGTYRGYELPSYQVIEQEGLIELRHYQPQLVAEVITKGSRDDAVGDGFRILAKYIFGDNEGSEKVAMTSPVVQKPAGEVIAMTSPVVQRPQNDEWVVQFGMPKHYTLDSLPKTKDDRIRFRIINGVTTAAIRFSGRWSDNAFTENKEALQRFIEKRKLTPVSPPRFAYYDDPFTFPWNRRNEILIDVKPSQ